MSEDHTCPNCGSTKREVRGSVYRCIGDYEHSPHPCPDPSHDATPERTLEAMLADAQRVRNVCEAHDSRHAEVLPQSPNTAACDRLEADLRDSARLREAAMAFLTNDGCEPSEFPCGGEDGANDTCAACMDEVRGSRMDLLRAALERSHR